MAEFNLFKEWARMVKADDNGLCTIECKTCDFNKPAENRSCACYVRSNPDEAEAIIRKWAEKHPVKTRQSEFLKMFPNARLNQNGTLDICPNLTTDNRKCQKGSCEECLKNYWQEVIE